MGAAGASGLAESCLVTARHQWEPTALALPFLRARQSLEPSRRRRSPLPQGWHMGSFPVAEGSRTCAEGAELQHRCRSVPPLVHQTNAAQPANVSMQSLSRQRCPRGAQPRAGAPPRCLRLHSLGPGKRCEPRGTPLGLCLAPGSSLGRVSSP